MSEDAVVRDERFAQASLAEITLGLDAESFLRSKLGVYLMEYAAQSAMSAMDLLKKVDPNDAVRIRALQNEVFRAESFPHWIDMAITAGQRAEQELQET